MAKPGDYPIQVREIFRSRRMTGRYARKTNRPGLSTGPMILGAFNAIASHDPAETRVDGAAAHRRFDPAAHDADVAERAIVEFVQCLDGLAAREIGDDAVYPFAEQAEEAAHRAVGHRLAYGSGYRRHRTSPCFHAAKPLPPTQTLARALAP